jgi:SpoVK/Ycf46/Vps4 family AAA+-type ATPase
MVHQAVPMAPGDAFDRGAAHGDARWVLCRRPVVMSGAELTLDMVDLEFDRQTRFYHAPQQLKANNGLFIIDDLGRQLVSAQALMNRWIVPLDRRTDFLTLHTGQKFEVPFDVIVVFSSNLRPADLADDAFLRRLGYKIFVGPADVAEYRAILQQVCRDLRMPYDEAGLAHLLRRHEAASRPLLACHPRDLLGQVRDYAVFNDVSAQMSPELLDWAWNNYFAPEANHTPAVAAVHDIETGDRT